MPSVTRRADAAEIDADSRFLYAELPSNPTISFCDIAKLADLAHAHMLHLWETEGGNEDQIVIAVPGLYTEEQLGLLLGIAEACHIPVGGLVDAAVAAAVDRPARSKCLHLDIHLHRAVLTELDRGSHRARVQAEHGRAQPGGRGP
mgnify:CR=1 FL=1